MDKRNLLLLGFAVIAIGLFIIPNTMSMFVGQHRWYSVRTAEGQYDLCRRCHTAEVGEWEANTGAHSAYRDYYKKELKIDPGCFCHQINETRLNRWINTTNISKHGYQFFNQSGTVNGSDPDSWEAGWRNTSTPHAAVTIYCVECHINSTAQLSKTDEAHKAFFEYTRDAAGFKADSSITNNTACMACHTMVGLNVTMSRLHGGLIINATHEANYTWSINVTLNTTRTTNSSYWPPGQNITNITS